MEISTSYLSRMVAKFIQTFNENLTDRSITEINHCTSAHEEKNAKNAE
jgi:hypothetical protein